MWRRLIFKYLPLTPALSMNRLWSSCSWLETEAVLTGQLFQQPFFSHGDFFFIFLESVFDIGPALDHQTVG